MNANLKAALCVLFMVVILVACGYAQLWLFDVVLHYRVAVHTLFVHDLANGHLLRWTASLASFAPLFSAQMLCAYTFSLMYSWRTNVPGLFSREQWGYTSTFVVIELAVGYSIYLLIPQWQGAVELLAEMPQIEAYPHIIDMTRVLHMLCVVSVCLMLIANAKVADILRHHSSPPTTNE